MDLEDSARLLVLHSEVRIGCRPVNAIRESLCNFFEVRYDPTGNRSFAKLDTGARVVKVVPFVVTYNGMATGPYIKRCVSRLMARAPSFGSAIERVDLYPHCQTRDPIVDGLEFMWDQFQVRLATLPFIQFRRKARLFEVAFASHWVHSDAMFDRTDIDLSPSEFNCLCREFAAALSLIRRRLKKSDAFDMDLLDAHLKRRLESSAKKSPPRKSVRALKEHRL